MLDTTSPAGAFKYHSGHWPSHCPLVERDAAASAQVIWQQYFSRVASVDHRHSTSPSAKR
jgi:hypothetical protein